MCGLVGLISKKGRPVGQQVYNLYAQQKSRGKEGFGYLAIDGKCNLIGIHRSRYEFEIRDKLMKETAEIILFHHRMPTSTKNTLGTTHPIFVSNDELDHDYFFAHNGVITNKEHLKKVHNEKGYVYNTEFTEFRHIVYNDGRTEDSVAGSAHFNDSESLAIELARYCDGMTAEINTTGAAAFWGIQLEKGTNHVKKIYYGKNNGRDLKMTSNKKYWGIASEKGSDIDPMKLFILDLVKGDHYEDALPIDEWIKQTSRVGYGANWNVSPPAQQRSLYEGLDNYNALENKEYTREEALDTGVPLSEFFSEDKPYGRIYVPTKYAQQTTKRQKFLLGLPPGELDTDELGFPNSSKQTVSEKVRGQLEDWCMKYVEFETKKDTLDSAYDTGHLDKSQYEKQVRQYERQMQEYDEKISALDIPEGELDEMYALCRDMFDYNNSYSMPDDEIEYIQMS